MIARHAVLLTPSESSGPTQLLFYKQNATVSPLFATLTSRPQLTENTTTLSPFPATLTAYAAVTPVFATLTQTAGGAHHLVFQFWNSPPVTRHYSPCEAHQSARFFALIPAKTQKPLLCFQSFANNSAFTGGWGVASFKPNIRSFLASPGIGRSSFATRLFLHYGWPLRAASNSSPGTQPASFGDTAALSPSAKPKRAMAASPVKSISGLYSSLGWW
jgi:hypothetical protein